MEKRYCVISHTHWDREWYLPFENFRVKLVELIDNLLDIMEAEPEFRFHLDAQTIVLEDYLEIRPEQREVLVDHIKQGRILVGPWYIHNDFFLTSGEATIRNLLIGSRLAQQFGHCTMVGYVPDQFGLISQLPQIFAKAGIDTALFGRGYSFPGELKKSEFSWKSDNGSQVLAVHMPFWYNNAQRFSANIDRAERMLTLISDRLSQTATTPYYLLMNGVDHLEAQEDLLPILHQLNLRLPENEKIVQTTMPEYMAMVKESTTVLDEYVGEMRHGGKWNILAGTLSSRVYLKQWNVRSQTMLENRLEPLYTFLHTAGIHSYPSGYLRYLWKLLLQNHPHDSICGCSVDRVHEHMVDRFKRIEEVANDLLKRGLGTLASYVCRNGLSDDEYLITIFNTSSRVRSSVLEVDVEFPKAEAPAGFAIVDEQRTTVPYVVTGRRERVRDLLSPVNLPGMMEVVSYTVRLFVNHVPGMGYRSFVVTPSDLTSTAALEWGSVQTGHILENEYLRVQVGTDGSIQLTDKSTQVVYDRCLVFEDKEDTGDSYIYQHSGHDSVLSTQFSAMVEQFERDPLVERCIVTYLLKTPECYDFANDVRCPNTVDIPVRVQLTLAKGSKVLDVSIEIDNRAQDHRIRALFATPIQTSMSHAGSPFDVVVRDAKKVRTGEVEVAQQPNTSFVNLDDDGYGLAILNEGLYEYELILGNDSTTLALTLLRGNGFISRDSSGLPSADTWMVPGNQCLGAHTFRLGIYPHAGDLVTADVVQVAQDYLNPVLSYVQPVDVRKFAGGRPFVQDADVTELFFRDRKFPDNQLDRQQQLLAVEGSGIVLSALKKSEQGDSVIARFYNPSSEPATLSLTLNWGCEEAYFVNLLEHREASCPVNNRTVKGVQVAPKDIVTLALVYSKR